MQQCGESFLGAVAQILKRGMHQYRAKYCIDSYHCLPGFLPFHSLSAGGLMGDYRHQIVIIILPRAPKWVKSALAPTIGLSSACACF